MHTPYPLGRKVEHDPRSRRFAFTVDATPVVAKTWRRFGAVLDQGNLGSCTGNAMIHAMNSAPFHVTGTKCYGEAMAVMVYSLATGLDEFTGSYPPDDTGSSALGAAKAAMQMGMLSGYEHAFGFQHTLQSLMRSPVMIGTNWHYGMFFPDAEGYVKPTGSIEGGHEYLLVGVQPRSQTLIFQNSWSSLWGINGRFKMRYDDFATLLAADGDALIPIRK